MAAIPSFSWLIFFFALLQPSVSVIPNVLRLTDGGEPLEIPVYSLALHKSENLLFIGSGDGILYKADSTTMELVDSATIVPLQVNTKLLGVELDENKNHVYVLADFDDGVEVLIVNASNLAEIDSDSPSTNKALGSFFVESEEMLGVFVFWDSADRIEIYRYDVSGSSLPAPDNIFFDFLFDKEPPAFLIGNDTLVLGYKSNAASFTNKAFFLENVLEVSDGSGEQNAFLDNGPPYPLVEDTAPFSGDNVNGNHKFLPQNAISWNNEIFATYISTTVPSKGSAIVKIPRDLSDDEVYLLSLHIFDDFQVNSLFFDSIVTPSGNGILFLGTNEGELLKYTVNHTTDGEIFIPDNPFNEETIVDAQIPPFTGLYPDPENREIYLFSSDLNGGVWKVPFSSCELKTDCGSCLSFQDPYCGWCPLQGACTTEQECTNCLFLIFFQPYFSSFLCQFLTK